MYSEVRARGGRGGVSVRELVPPGDLGWVNHGFRVRVDALYGADGGGNRIVVDRTSYFDPKPGPSLDWRTKIRVT